MFKRTAFIVGAGASAEFGLPTGEKVFREFCNEIEKYRINPKTDFVSDPFGASIFNFLGTSDVQHVYRDLLERFEKSTSNSIDRVADLNPDAEQLCKYVSSFYILKQMYDQPKNCLLYTSPSPRDKRQSRMPSSA